MVFYSFFFFFTFTGTTNILAHTLYGIKHAVTATLHIVMGKYFYIHYQSINNKAVVEVCHNQLLSKDIAFCCVTVTCIVRF